MASLDKAEFVSNILKYTTTTTTSTRNIDINKQDDNKSDDDETIWFTENDTQESGNESDIQESDDSDFEIVEDDSDDDDYSNNLFTVEFNDDDGSNDYQEERENILQANKRWNGDIDIDHCSCTPARVTFSDDVEIYPAGDFCRKSPWEICALDRMRFRRRIEETERILYRILSSEHRRKVLSRF